MANWRSPETEARIQELMDLIGKDEFDVDPDAWISSLDAHAHSIGTLCQNWAHLETAVRALLRALARLPDDVASDLVLRCFDFRDQLNAIKVAGVSAPLSAALVDEVIQTVNYIDNTLRPRRNRLIHDLWIENEGDEAPTRMIVSPKIKKAQARQRASVHVETQTDDIGDVLATATTTARHVAFVKRLTATVERPTRYRIAKLLQGRPERPQFLPQQGKPRPAGKPKQGRARQRRSSMGKSKPQR